MFGSTFGASTQQPSSGGGLFGSGAGTPLMGGGGGMFGGASTNTGLGGFNAPGSTGGGGGMFGSSAGGGGGMFGSSTGGGGGYGAPGGSMFGTSAQQQQQTGTGSMFGMSAPQQQQTGTGSLFGGGGGGGGLFGGGGAPPTSSGGGLFGGSSTSGGGLFGGGAQQGQTSMFATNTGGSMFGAPAGSPTPGGSSLFGGGAVGNSMFGGGGGSMMSPQPGMRPAGSLFSPGASVPMSSMPMAQPINIPQYPFYGFPSAEPLLKLPEAKDLQFLQVKPSSRITLGTPAPTTAGQPAQQPTNPQQIQQEEMYLAVQANRIPRAFQEQLEQQQVEINQTGAQLDGLNIERIDGKITKLLSLTKDMESAVRKLEIDLERQRRSVSGLLSDVKTTCKEAERGGREARAMVSRGTTGGSGVTTSFNPAPASLLVASMPSQLPSQFFWNLLAELEDKVADYEARADEIRAVLASNVGGEEGRRKVFASKLETSKIIDIIMHQYKTFKLLEEEAARVHAVSNELRRIYSERHMRLHGEVPQDFDVEDMLERDRQRRLLRKVENLRLQHSKANNAISAGGAVPISAIPGTTGAGPNPSLSAIGSTGGLFGSTTTPGQASGAGGGMFGAATPGAFGGGGSGSLFSPAPAGSTGGGGMFGGATMTPGLSGGASFLSPIPAAGGGFMSPSPAGGMSTPAQSTKKSRRPL